LALGSAAGFVAALPSYLTSDQPTPTGGALLHVAGLTFGPTEETLIWLRLWIWGFALVAVAAVLARRSREGESLDVSAA
jgi:hypothetical protein